MRDLTQGIIAVTGASRGIGAATARRLADEGSTVFICGRTGDDLADVAGSSSRIHATQLNICDDDAVAAWMDEIRDDTGRIDVLINNAGVLGPRARLVDTPVDRWRHTIAVNINGTFVVTRRAFPLLTKADNPLVINVSSSVGRRGRGEWGAYSVSKFGIEGLAEVTADELDEAGGCVVTLNPGGTATRMRAKAYPDEDPSTLPSTDEVAETIRFLVEKLTPAENGRKYSSRSLFSVLETELEPGEIPTADL